MVIVLIFCIFFTRRINMVIVMIFCIFFFKLSACFFQTILTELMCIHDLLLSLFWGYPSVAPCRTAIETTNTSSNFMVLEHFLRSPHTKYCKSRLRLCVLPNRQQELSICRLRLRFPRLLSCYSKDILTVLSSSKKIQHMRLLKSYITVLPFISKTYAYIPFVIT